MFLGIIKSAIVDFSADSKFVLDTTAAFHEDNSAFEPVSYTHLTLPTTPYV